MKPQIAWITGGGTGIGRALAQALYQDGHRVVISGRRSEVLEQAAREIQQQPSRGSIWAIAGNAGDPNFAPSVRQQVLAKWGEIDWLINNAGVNDYKNFQQATPADFEASFRINCLSAIYCTRVVLPAMQTRRAGAIVNVSSVLGKWASPSSSSYSVSKYALTGFTESLRQELIGSGVHIMGVYPGFIRTAMTQPFVTPGSRRDRAGKTPEQMAAQIVCGLYRKKRDVMYPWYVPLGLHLHQLFPSLLEKLRSFFER